MSATKALLLLCIISYSICQVMSEDPPTALKCYQCQSLKSKDCGKNEEDNKDCAAPDAGGAAPNRCITVTGKKGDEFVFLLGCGLDSETEAQLKERATKEIEGFTAENAKICETAGCNTPPAPSTGSRLSIGSLSVMGAFLPLVVGKP